MKDECYQLLLLTKKSVIALILYPFVACRLGLDDYKSSKILSLRCYLIYSPLVATTLKISIKEDVHHFKSFVL